MKHIIHIVLYLSSLSDNTVLFEIPVIVKKEGISIFECWGVSLHDGLWLMDETGNWYELEETDRNFREVVEALDERLTNKNAIAA